MGRGSLLLQTPVPAEGENHDADAEAASRRCHRPLHPRENAGEDVGAVAVAAGYVNDDEDSYRLGDVEIEVVVV